MEADLASGFLGGILIGLSASLLLLLNGRVAGISGIASSLLNVKHINIEYAGSLLFLIGLVSAAALYLNFNHSAEIILTSNKSILIVAGLLVGIGTRLGSGCTSGHGICGISRLSKRSIIATLIFMAIAILTVFIKKQIGL